MFERLRHNPGQMEILHDYGGRQLDLIDLGPRSRPTLFWGPLEGGNDCPGLYGTRQRERTIDQKVGHGVDSQPPSQILFTTDLITALIAL
jgi:hypothetical protein